MEETQLGNRGTEFESSVLQIAKLIAWIGEESRNQEAITLAIGAALISTRSAETEAFQWVTQALDGISDPGEKANAIEITDVVVVGVGVDP